MEVGIEDCLHIEFEYNKSKYHLNDAVLGKIFFLLVLPATCTCSIWSGSTSWLFRAHAIAIPREATSALCLPAPLSSRCLPLPAVLDFKGIFHTDGTHSAGSRVR